MTPLESFELGNFDESIISLCMHGVEPFSQDAKVLRAMATLNRGDESATKEILSTCSEQDPHVQKMLGYFAYNEDRFEEALSHYRRSLELDPHYAHAAHDLGVACSALGQHSEARRWLERACAIRPDWALARMDLGIVKLGACDESGWIDYEARHEARGTKVDYDAPEWDGSDIAGKRFFLLAEQGFGDQIQFLRYARHLSDMGARVLVGVSEKLRRFEALQAGVSEVYVMGKPVAPFDTWLCAMSMPRLMGGLRSMGGPTLRIGRKGNAGTGLVGLNWKGNPEFKAERFRRIPVPALAPILRDHKCVRLPFDMADGEDGCEIPDFTSGCFDFLDTGMKMLDHLDAVVTSCSGIAHLAGSIGIPTVLCLPENFDFRWKIAPPEFYYPNHVTVVNTTTWEETMVKANEALRDIL